MEQLDFRPDQQPYYRGAKGLYMLVLPHAVRWRGRRIIEQE